MVYVLFTFCRIFNTWVFLESSHLRGRGSLPISLFISTRKLIKTGQAGSKRCSIHAPNLTDELSTAEERHLNQFGSAD